MTSHPDPSVLTAMLRDREREADATSEEVARLRAEVAGLTAERDWLLNRYVDATNCEAEALRIASSAMREGLAECKRLRCDLRTLREHVRWYLTVHKDRPGKQNSRQNEHDREESRMLLWQWVRFGKLCDGIDTPLADDEKLWAVVEAAREVMTARDEVSGGTWGFLVMAEDRLRGALARLDGGP